MIQLRHALLLSASILAAVAQTAMADTNVALNKTVTVGGGAFGGSSSTWGAGGLAQPSTITDGVFVTNGLQWNSDTVFWYTGDTQWIDIDLGATYNINRIVLQADNNDYYRISYRNTSNTWSHLADIDPNSAGWGMATGTLSLLTPITTSMFRITDGPAGDCCDSVSEFQAFGVAPIPEPETYAMMLAGLGLLGFVARRRKQAAMTA